MISLRRGLIVLFTGLSGAGKSTLGFRLGERLERLGRTITLLDGDRVRTLLSNELGYSREHRDLHVRRIGFVASEIARHGGVAICSLIAPYDVSRKAVRAMAESVGGFLLVYLATPLEVCERRDPKGLYAKARIGQIPFFTGVSDPYDPPGDADVELDTSGITPDEGVEAILRVLWQRGYL